MIGLLIRGKPRVATVDTCMPVGTAYPLPEKLNKVFLADDYVPVFQ